ncbi:S8 family peptidase [Pseudomonas glycinae]|uniref:Peptidase S8 n=1 Tax=Pseudomonas glycinae TaxID=1785145 RepID=A0ABM5ZT46_9PSED|nr:S8 family peptidase [Pseudomonas glycinae]AMQ86890.1 peptidase S8 [Pseudomonas glycinae]
MNNFIVGYGETLTTKVDIGGGGGDKKHPYTISDAIKRISSQLEEIIIKIESKPDAECAGGKVVVKFIQHPSYLAKSYYPRKLFSAYGMDDIGSRAVTIKPEKWGVTKHPEAGLASCVFVSGTKDHYRKLLTDLKSSSLSRASEDVLRTLERIEYFDADEKIKNIDASGENLNLEVVIHASADEDYIVRAFDSYTTLNGGAVRREKAKIVGGLTFLPVNIPRGKEQALANFAQLRVLRSIPKLRMNKPDALRSPVSSTVKLPDWDPDILSRDFKVCIFDGGLGDGNQISNWVTEIVPEGMEATNPEYLAHGSEVCSAYLFGPAQGADCSLGAPYTPVDIVRVICQGDDDPDLFDVLTRIENVLKLKIYKYINLSLGPNIAIDDDEVHVWTSVIDALLQDGDCLAVVAVGNDGDLPGDYGRVQPPSDMVNSLSVGASDGDDDGWARAPYSCMGPGRSPGVVKPDGVIFGGSPQNLFRVYSPRIHSFIDTMGTSYAAPYALRVAAGIDAITNFDLSTNTVKALMVHSAKQGVHDLKDVGWGKFPTSPESVITCLDDEATIVFQGELENSKHLRIPVPLPLSTDATWVHLSATFCISAIVDPEHPLHYTRSGLEISFRANEDRFTMEGANPDTKPFFSLGKLYPSEYELREDAHKWETTLSKHQRFKRTTLQSPVFDVKYHAREQGGAISEDLPAIRYTLILTIRAEGDTSIYNKILQENRTLQAINVRSRIEV